MGSFALGTEDPSEVDTLPTRSYSPSSLPLPKLVSLPSTGSAAGGRARTKELARGRTLTLEAGWPAVLTIFTPLGDTADRRNLKVARRPKIAPEEMKFWRFNSTLRTASSSARTLKLA